MVRRTHLHGTDIGIRGLDNHISVRSRQRVIDAFNIVDSVAVAIDVSKKKEGQMRSRARWSGDGGALQHVQQVLSVGRKKRRRKGKSQIKEHRTHKHPYAVIVSSCPP